MPRSVPSRLGLAAAVALCTALPAAAAQWQLDRGNDFDMAFVPNDAATHEFAVFCDINNNRSAYLGVRVPPNTQAHAVVSVTATTPQGRTFTSAARVSAVPGWVYAYFNDSPQRINQLIELAEGANPTITVTMLLGTGQAATTATFNAMGSDRTINRFKQHCERFRVRGNNDEDNRVRRDHD